ncbi:transaldolase [Massilia sp. TSP1-1-2]|uniref:transaldolase n=1 Tax=Massilia sp. TSP1-1-2 TaxID=2804649 RepID=UPI003CFB1A29
MTETSAFTSRLKAVAALGQQVWLDNLSHELVSSGALAAWIRDDGVQGVTSNPSIFYNAIRSDPAYQAALPALRLAFDNLDARFEALVLPDVQRACDLFAPLYAESDGKAGFVSFEVAPCLAHDAAGTVADSARLWAAIDRPNAMIKIPATEAGIAALEQVIFAGINVNVTLIFGPRQLAAVRAAHRRGLARRLEARLSVQRIASVASVFISRVDAAVDALLPAGAAHLKGRAAIAAARLAYRDFCADSSFAVFAAFGATPQWLLWASTGTKDPAMRDVAYVEELIGGATVNTVPDATLAAFRDHGEARLSLAEGEQEAQAVLLQLGRHGIDLDTIGNDLLCKGLTQFEQAHASLLALLA